jgi:APA family basic amino acid/polyamine antiporter
MEQATRTRAPAAAGAARLQSLSLLDATMLVIGSMIGSGIFIVSADIARTMSSPGGLLVVWAATGVITLLGALSLAELAAAMPRAGGPYVFLREALGPLPAFLFGWTMFVVIQTGSIAAVAIAFARFTAVLFPWITPDVFYSLGSVRVPGGSIEMGLSAQRVLAVLVVAVLTVVNLRGLREARWVQNTFTFAKLGALGLLIAGGLIAGLGGAASAGNFGAFWEGTPTGGAFVLAFGAAAVGALFSSDSWNNVTFAAAEVRRPERNLPLALALGTGVVTTLYLLANFAYLAVLPIAEIQGAPQDRVGTALVARLLGEPGAYLMAGAIALSCFGCLNGLILAGARVLYALARDGLFFAAAGKLSPRTGMPAAALLLQAGWTCVLALSGSYAQLLDYVIFAALLFYALTTIALFALRRSQPGLHRPYRAIGYPVLPALYICAALGIAVILLVQKPAYSFTGLFLVLIGVPVYWARVSREAQVPAADEAMLVAAVSITTLDPDSGGRDS